MMFIHLLDFRGSAIVNQGSIVHTSITMQKKNPDYNHVVKKCDAMNLQTPSQTCQKFSFILEVLRAEQN